jgi:hypothetical protein
MKGHYLYSTLINVQLHLGAGSGLVDIEFKTIELQHFLMLASVCSAATELDS